MEQGATRKYSADHSVNLDARFQPTCMDFKRPPESGLNKCELKSARFNEDCM